MQPLSGTSRLPTTAVTACEVLNAVPPVIWFIRRQMRSHRGGLSLPQFRALYKVDTDPAASLSAVAEHLGASRPTTSRMVQGLVTRGFMKRSDCTGDRRRRELEITSRGRAVLEAARAVTQKQMEIELAGLSPEEREAVGKAMGILKGIFGVLGFPEDGGEGHARGKCEAESVSSDRKRVRVRATAARTRSR